MVLTDGAGVIFYANPASEALLGLSASELVGRTGFDMCRAEDVPLAQDAFARCLTQPGEPVSLQVVINHGLGGVRALAVRLNNRLAEPRVEAVVVHFYDVADPRMQEQQAEHYRAIFESAPIGLGVADLDGRLLVFNTAMLQHGGYTRDEILAIGNVAKLYCSAAERDRVLAIARKQGRVWREEVQFRRKSGACYDALLSLAPVRFAGRPCWLAAVEDISERQRAEEQHRLLEARLRHAQKMEAVGRMTAGIAHDFNNVLSVILASSQLIADTPGDAAQEIDENIELLRASAERGAAMVGKLLGYSRAAPLKVEPTDLLSLVKSLGSMVRHLVPEHISIDVTGAPGSGAVVDPAAVEQMVLNLVTNAHEAMTRGGALRIDVSPLVVDQGDKRLTWMPAGLYVRLAVTDTGVGMDPVTRAHVFEPFFTTKPAGVGTGLGLSMVFGLAKQQQGFVDVQSEPGKGTTVSLYFPHTAEGRRHEVATPTGGWRGGHETILLIEDDAELRHVGTRVLKRLGYTVLPAADGVEGLAIYRARRKDIHLVIADVVMPLLSGIEVYEAVRGGDPAIRFLLSSGYGAATLPTGKLPAEIKLLPKPWTVEGIARKVREVLDAKGEG